MNLCSETIMSKVKCFLLRFYYIERKKVFESFMENANMKLIYEYVAE